eukprot:GHVU01062041.1.p1 GENE.GHVU01062041.1~~GHVU01062041.1.p1  ORF type:complete len:120 (+),score=22.04 GHVU01062041.1:75-434(+)
MGKKKGKQPGKQQKNASVFKVVGSKVTKSKHKTKAVSTNLKKMNSKVTTDQLDDTYKSLKGSIHTSQKTKPAAKSSTKKSSGDAPLPKEVNMDVAATDFAKLCSSDQSAESEEVEETIL